MSRLQRIIRGTAQHVPSDWRAWATATLLFLGIVLRGLELGSIPEGLNQDEAASGYDSFALLTAGIDRTGLSFPVHLPSWGSGMNALAAYLTMPSIALFGLTPFAIRLPFFLVGVTGLFVFHRLLRRTADEDTALLGVLLLAVNPWHIMISRWGLESNMFPSFFLFAVTALAVAVAEKSARWYVASAVLFGLCGYAYGTSYAMLPVFLAGAGAYLLWKRKISRTHAVLFAAVTVVVAAPIALFVIINSFDLPTIALGPFTIPRLATEARFATAGVGSAGEFLGGFSGKFTGFLRLLGSENDGLIWNSYHPYGLFSGVGILLFFIGLPVVAYRTFTKKSYSAITFVLLWLLASFLVTAFTDVNVNRINIVFLPIIALAAVGFRAIARNRTAFACCIAAVFLSTIGFVPAYFGRYARDASSNFVSGVGDAIAFAATTTDDGVCVTDHMNMAYVQALVATATPPNVFVKTVQYDNPGQEFQVVRSFGRYTFGTNACDPSVTDAFVLRSDENVPFAVGQPGFETRFFPGFVVYYRPSRETP